MEKLNPKLFHLVLIIFFTGTGTMKMCPIYFLVLIFLFQSNFSAFINPCGILVVHLKCNFNRPHVFAHEFNESPQIS